VASLGSRSTQQFIDAVEGPIEQWFDVHHVHQGMVEYAIHYHFAWSNKEVVAESKLRFRTKAELASSLAEAGFITEHVYGGWDRLPAGPSTEELIFVAVRI
jgi:hypothetical protein